MLNRIQPNLRHEYKYLLYPSTYFQLRESLKKIMKTDENADINREYHIRSLYFDDIYDTALSEKLLGKNSRVKYRIRIYDYSDKLIKLEIKEKYNDYIAKKSTAITREEYERILDKNITFLCNSNNAVKERFYFEMRNSLLNPKVVVDYYREAYIFPYNQIRITFDKNLSAAPPVRDIFNEDLFTMQVGQAYSIIMEIKYNNFLPNKLRDILQMHDLTRIAASKYVICREYIKH